ncbi:MAG TPA: hypothetical protein VNS32_28355, partial [Flavisolibacter sp.]|nr:hypothetical protein [Flavisolibacter sp.]
KIHVYVRIERFDKDFFSLDTNHLESGIQQLKQKYPSFLPLYFEFLSPINGIVKQEGKTFNSAFNEYFRVIKPLADAVQKKYSNLDEQQKGLQQNLRYVKYYYPNFKIPAVIASVESLNPDNPQEIYGTTYYDDTLILSLQMFMGKDFSAYDPSQYFDYIRRRFEPQYIVPNSIRAIANVIYADSSQTASLIEQIIEKGKQWYLLDKFLPDTPDSLKTGFTKRQLQFCKENEGNIWGAILSSSQDLYTIDQEIIQNYIGEAPFTQNMPPESPGNIGQWVGWQIVKKFESLHPDLTVQQILATPAKKLFQESKYKPK